MIHVSSKSVQQTQYERADGTALVHIIPECPRNYHLGYIIKKGSPYQAGFIRILTCYFEAGMLIFLAKEFYKFK